MSGSDDDILAEPDYLRHSFVEVEKQRYVRDLAKQTYLGEIFFKSCYEQKDSVTSVKELEATRWMRTLSLGVRTYPARCDIRSLEGLHKLTRIDQDLLIGDCKLTSLHGLRGLRQIGGDLLVSTCAPLNTLSGLRSLEVVGGIRIKNNEHLSELGLDSLQRVTGESICIVNNPKLPSAEAEAFVARMRAAGFTGGVTIQGNLGPAGEATSAPVPKRTPGQNLRVESWDQHPSTAVLKSDESAAHWPFGEDRAELLSSLDAQYMAEFIRQARILVDEHALRLPEEERAQFLAREYARLESYRKS